MYCLFFPCTRSYSSARSLPVFSAVTQKYMMVVNRAVTPATQIDLKALATSLAFCYCVNFINEDYQQQFEMRQSYSKMPASEPNKLIIERICQQIEQDVQTLLNNLSVDHAGQINIKILQKCIVSTKYAIVRAITSRLPQLTAVEQKFKTLFIQINQELEMQKQKNRDMCAKYQQKILQCDKYKMETVQLSQLYEIIYKQNMEVKLKLVQSEEQEQKRAIETQIQTEYPYPYEEEQNQSRSNKEKMQLYQEQRELFHEQMNRYSMEIEQLKHNELVANQRIHNLLEEVKNMQNLVEELSDTKSMLKNQITKLVIEVEQNKLIVEEQVKNNLDQRQYSHKALLEQQNKFQLTIRQLKNKLKNQQEIISGLEKKIVGVQKELNGKQEERKQLEVDSKQLKQKLNRIEGEAGEKDRKIEELTREVTKIKGITENQCKLQDKYGKKVKLLSKHNEQMHEKLNFYKVENERLYEAMEKYQTKQNKLNNMLTNAQSKLQKSRQSLEQLRRTKADALQKIMKIKKELKQLKKNEFQIQSQKNIRYLLQSFKQQVQKMCKQLEQKHNKKLIQLQHQWEEQRSILEQKYRNSEDQFKLLQQKSLQSQINSNRVANALVESKNEVYMQIGYKDEIIKCLEQQILKEKQFNELSIMRLHQVVKKYENGTYSKTTIGSHKSFMKEKDQTLIQLQSKVAHQKNRFIELQYQYKDLI